MSTISELLGAEAAPVEFTHGGKTYAVGAVTMRAKSRVERWLRAAAYRDLYESREDMPAGMYQDCLSLLLSDRGRFAYLGPAYWAAMGTEEGSVGMVSILFDCPEGEARRLVAERREEVAALVTEAVLASMPRPQADAVREKLRRAAAGGPEGGGGANPPTPA